MLIESLPDIVGLTGVGVILLWYFLLQTGKCTAEDLNFSLFNALGSCCLLYSLSFNWNLPNVAIEVAWLGISLYGVGKSLKRRRRPTLSELED